MIYVIYYEYYDFISVYLCGSLCKPCDFFISQRYTEFLFVKIRVIRGQKNYLLIHFFTNLLLKKNVPLPYVNLIVKNNENTFYCYWWKCDAQFGYFVENQGV